MSRRAWCTRRAGACQSRQRSVLEFGTGEVPGEAEELEPAHEVSSETDGGEPGPVGVEVAEGEPAQPGVLEPADVVFDVRGGRAWSRPG